MSSNAWAFASSIQRENLELGDCMLLALERYAERTRERSHLLTGQDKASVTLFTR